MPLRLSLGFIVRKLLLLTTIISSFSFVHKSQGAVTLSPNAAWTPTGVTVAGTGDGTGGTSVNSLSYPLGIAISNDDVLYIADTNNSRVIGVNLQSSTEKIVLGTGYGVGPSQFRFPNDVYVTESEVYVLDTSNYRIQKRPRNGANPTILPGANTFGVAYYFFIDKNDNAYLSLVNDNKIIRFSPNSSNSATVAGTGVAGNTSSQFNGPRGIFVDENSAMYIADRYNHRVQKWNYGASYGTTVAGNGIAGSTLSQLREPVGIVLDTNSYIYIVDAANIRVVRWAPNAVAGSCIAGCTRTSGTQAYQFSFPIELAFDSNGSLYVSDPNNNRVQKFQVLNNYVGPPTSSTTTTTTTSTTSATKTTTTTSTTTSTTSATTTSTTTSTTSATTTSTTTSMTSTATITINANIILFGFELLILIMSVDQVY